MYVDNQESYIDKLTIYNLIIYRKVGFTVFEGRAQPLR